VLVFELGLEIVDDRSDLSEESLVLREVVIASCAFERTRQWHNVSSFKRKSLDYINWNSFSRSEITWEARYLNGRVKASAEPDIEANSCKPQREGAAVSRPIYLDLIGDREVLKMGRPIISGFYVWILI
jgi:hypothetical protein